MLLQQHGHSRAKDPAQGEEGPDHRYKPALWRRHGEHLSGDHDVKIVNPWSVDENFQYLELDESRYLGQVEDAFHGFDCDIVGVSAGFDTYLEDWGGLLNMEDYGKIGKAIREGAEEMFGYRGFPVLEESTL